MIITTILFAVLLALRFRWKVVQPIKNAMKDIQNIDHWIAFDNLLEKIPLQELYYVSLTLVEKQNALNSIQLELANSKVKAKLSEIALEVAHDIRSPLSSMQAALGYLSDMKIADPKNSEVLNLLELSAKRLTNIADDLLKKHRGEGEAKTIFSLHQVLDELIGEYQGRGEFKEVAFAKEYSSQAIQVLGRRTALQRAFGNIIKNAIEAMEKRGQIVITTKKFNGMAIVKIADTGHGIPSEKLDRILEGGFTEGKQDGHGIGMKVVKETVSEFGGELRAESTIGQGTIFYVILPLHSTEEIFTLEVITNKAAILIVDDDAGIREQWRLLFKEKGLKTILCESYEDVEQQQIQSNLTKTAIVDYHFENSEKNGADVIGYLQQIGFKNLYLCTAEYWKPSIQKLAKELGVLVCPKPLPEIKLHYITEKKQTDGFKVLVVDDDEAIRSAWELVQNKLKIKQLHCYPNLEALQQNGTSLSEIDLAFVDKNIKDSAFNGAEVIEYLSGKEVKKIILASGENAEALRKDPQYSKAHYFIDEKIPKSLEMFLN